MRILKLATTYKVESSSRPGTWYFVDPDKGTCTCPEYLFRMKRIGGICKHINAVEERSSKRPTVMTKKARREEMKDVARQAKEKARAEDKKKMYDAILAHVAVRGSVDTIDLIDRYDEGPVEDLIRLGELIEKDGKVRLLE